MPTTYYQFTGRFGDCFQSQIGGQKFAYGMQWKKVAPGLVNLAVANGSDESMVMMCISVMVLMRMIVMMLMTTIVMMVMIQKLMRLVLLSLVLMLSMVSIKIVLMMAMLLVLM